MLQFAVLHQARVALHHDARRPVRDVVHGLGCRELGLQRGEERARTARVRGGAVAPAAVAHDVALAERTLQIRATHEGRVVEVPVRHDLGAWHVRFDLVDQLLRQILRRRDEDAVLVLGGGDTLGALRAAPGVLADLGGPVRRHHPAGARRPHHVSGRRIIAVGVTGWQGEGEQG